MIRLDKFLAEMGISTRSTAKKILKSGSVIVNGEVIKDGKMKLDPIKSTVTVDGERLHYQQYYYYMLNKPSGVLSAKTDNKVKTVIDLIHQSDYRTDLFPVGRLDKDTTGLLLITNDGVLAHELLSPKKHIEKTYQATINGIVTPADIRAFQAGLVINSEFTALPGKLVILSTDQNKQQSLVQVTISEGKYHQVKRMFIAIGKEVMQLKRLSMGSLSLDTRLVPGQYRVLTDKELMLLK